MFGTNSEHRNPDFQPPSQLSRGQLRSLHEKLSQKLLEAIELLGAAGVAAAGMREHLGVLGRGCRRGPGTPWSLALRGWVCSGAESDPQSM